MDIDDQHESHKGDSQSEVSEVLVKPNYSQVRAAIEILMNYLMINGTTELQGLVELEIISCVKQKKMI